MGKIATYCSKEYLFRKYAIDFDVKDKILTIRKPIEVEVFLKVREIAKKMGAVEIRVW